MLTRPHLLLFGPRRGMVGDPPRRLSSSVSVHPRSPAGTSSLAPPGWPAVAKSPRLTDFEPPRYISSLSTSKRPAEEDYAYPPPGFGGRRESRTSDEEDDAQKDTAEGSFLNMHAQSVQGRELTSVRGFESEGKGVQVPEMARTNGHGERLVVRVDRELEVVSDRDSRADTPVWH